MNQEKKIKIELTLTEKEFESFKNNIQILGEDAATLCASAHLMKKEKSGYFAEAMMCFNILRQLGVEGLKLEEHFIADLRKASGLNVSDVE